jgi:hypothetical protein
MIPLPKPVSSAVSGGFAQPQITWSRVAYGRRCEVKKNQQVVGTLQKPSFWSTNYLADSTGGHWLFRRAGFLCSGAEILDAATEQQIAQFKSDWSNGGTLTFSDGQTFLVKSSGWWRPVWMVTESGRPVVQVRIREMTVELDASAAANDGRVSLLILFTFYRMLQAEEDAASAVLVAAIS